MGLSRRSRDHYSLAHQRIIPGVVNWVGLPKNTTTTAMVFLIQNTQNRDALAVHLKLDELIRSIEEADNDLMHAEDETDHELAILKAKYLHLCEEHDALRQQVAHKAQAPAA